MVDCVLNEKRSQVEIEILHVHDNKISKLSQQ